MRRAAPLALLGLLGLALAACSGGTSDPHALVRSAGCSEDSECRMLGSDMVCRKGSCVSQAEAKAKEEAAKPAVAAAVAPAGPVADLKVRICPGFWNLDQNTGTLIARNTETGKRHYKRLGEEMEAGGFGDVFTFKGLAHGTYEVSFLTGVIAGGQKDLLRVKCAAGVECKGGSTRPVVLGGGPQTEEEKAAAAKAEAALLKKQKLEQGPACDFDVNG